MPEFICNLIVKHEFGPRSLVQPADKVAIVCAGWGSDDLKAIYVHVVFHAMQHLTLQLYAT